MGTQTTFRTVPEMFLHRISATPDKPAFMTPSGSDWKTIMWRETGDRVRAIAMGLRALGLENEQRGAILASTRVEWVFADLGILCAGGATTTIYPANTPDECAYILNDSGTRFVFVEDAGQLKKLQQERANLKDVKHVIVFDGEGTADGWALTLADLEKKGIVYDGANPGKYEENIRSITGDKLATLIYTSGTTGRPKGVELTHDCWVYEGEAIDSLGIIKIEDVQYFWLPLAHVFGKVLGAAQIRIGFPTAVDGRVEKLVDNLAVIKPTFICAVPRIFEKVYNKVVAGASAAGGAKWKIFRWAVGVGREVSRLRQDHKEPSGLLAFKYSIADKLVFSKLRARFGGRVRFFISGSAPLSKELAEFFHGAGILILEGYGLTESSAASCVNRPDTVRFGTVGPPLQGVEIKIAESDGEILLRGRGIMRGYHNLPEATAEALDKEGYLHTGDIGEIGADGLLRITDRKKDLIKTSGGKYVAPQNIEGRLKMTTRYISQVVVHGNNRNFVSALITINEEEVRPWATNEGIGNLSYAELAANDRVRSLISPAIEDLNKQLAKHETIKKFALLPAELTIESGDLTPSMKVKRKAVETKYKDVLDGLYAGAIKEV